MQRSFEKRRIRGGYGIHPEFDFPVTSDLLTYSSSLSPFVR